MNGLVMFILISIIAEIAPGVIYIICDWMAASVPGEILMLVIFIGIIGMAYFMWKEENK